LSKKMIKDIGVLVFSFVCEVCFETRIIFFPLKEKDTIGVKCGNCDNILWFNSRESKILKEFDNPPFSHGEKYIKWRQEAIKRALAKFPVCPKCNEKKWSTLVINHIPLPLKCNKCSKLVNNPKLKDVTKDYLDFAVDWLEEDE